MKNAIIAIVVIIIIAIGGYYLYQNSSGTAQPASEQQTATSTQDVVQAQDVTVGTGATATPGSIVSVLYVGKLADGTVFDSSVQRGEPITLGLAGGVIKCWTEGVPLMKVGGKSRLVCPSDLAYGDQGRPPRIRPGATLVFEVELLEIVK